MIDPKAPLFRQPIRSLLSRTLTGLICLTLLVVALTLIAAFTLLVTLPALVGFLAWAILLGAGVFARAAWRHSPGAS